MIFSQQQQALLLELEYSYEEIKGSLSKLNKEQFIKTIGKKKRKLALKYHPDKNKGDAVKLAKFKSINEAYDQLLKMEDIQPDLFDYIEIKNIDIDMNWIDLRMEEQFDEYFEAILDQYGELEKEEDKKHFAHQHDSFLQVMHWLNKHRAELRSARDDAYYDFFKTRSLSEKVSSIWNQLIIKTFAEESLDDVTYREAIALGQIRPILATRKLLSPVKWLSLVICGLINWLGATFTHLIVASLNDLQNDLQKPKSWSNGLSIGFKLLMLGSLIVAPIVFIPLQYLQMVFIIPLLDKALRYLANPINQVVRPLAHHFNVSQIYVGLGLVFVSALTIGAALFLFTSNLPAMTILMGLSSVIQFSNMVSLGYLAKQFYDLSPQVGLIVAATFAISYVGTFLTYGGFIPPVAKVGEAVVNFLAALSSFSVSIIANREISQIKEKVGEIYSSLPMPKQPAPEETKEAFKKAANKNHWSHTFFNTPLTVQKDNQGKPKVSKEQNDTLADDSTAIVPYVSNPSMSFA